MSTREFWNEEPELLWTYRKVYMEKIKLQSEMDNFRAWLNGLYVFNALNTSLYNSFGRKETQPVINYIDKPFDLNKKAVSTEDLRKEEILRVEKQIKERNKQIKEILDRKK